MQDQFCKPALTKNQQDTDQLNLGIPLSLLQHTKVDIGHLSCHICKNILVRPVTCNHPNCFANFCSKCFENYESLTNLTFKEKQFISSQNSQKCPNCNKKIEKTQLPLIKNLLAQIILKCPFRVFGCHETIKYAHFFKHNQNCSFKRIKCQGCQLKFEKIQYDEHVKTCQGIKIQCLKCFLLVPRVHLKQHQAKQCLEEQLNQKNVYLSKVENRVQQLQNRINDYELIFQKIMKGQPLELQINFQTSFPNNFKIYQQSKAVVLQKASFNSTKQKYDFLHFYIKTPIVTSSIVGLEWKIQIKTLKGNLLIGICSSLSSNSVDLVMNKYGQIKKKEMNENRYRLIRKSQIIFSEGNTISFRFSPFKKSIEIKNQTKFIEGQLIWEQISCLGKEFYSFYSFDTLNDSLQFL